MPIGRSNAGRPAHGATRDAGRRTAGRDGAGGTIGAARVPSRAMFRRLKPVIAASLLVLLVAACGGAAIPVTSFDPASACTTDGRQPGAYPDLEALLPASYQGKAPSTRDSGRSCTTAALGTLASHGITGVRFAGETWPLGGSTALTIAVFEGTGLDAASMLDFYAVPAQTASHTDKLQVSDTTVAGKPAKRLDVLNSDGTAQTIVTWPGGRSGEVHVLLASDLGDTNVAAALETFGARP